MSRFVQLLLPPSGQRSLLAGLLGEVRPAPEALWPWRLGCIRLVERQPLQPLVLDHVMKLDAERNRAIDEMPELRILRLPALYAPICRDGDADRLSQLLLGHAPAHASASELSVGDGAGIMARR